MPARCQVMGWGHATSSGGSGRDQSPAAPSREGREAQDKGGKEPKIKEEKPLSGEKPQPAEGSHGWREVQETSWGITILLQGLGSITCVLLLVALFVNAALSGTRPKPQVLLTSPAFINFNVRVLSC